MSELAQQARPTGTGHDIPNSVLGKAFSILSAFDESTGSLTLAELSQRSGVPKSSVYRLAQELVGLGLLERVATRYRLGFGVFALSQGFSAGTRLRRAGRPAIVDLCAATHATAHLAVLEKGMTYYVEKLGGTKGVHVLSRVGGRLPLTCTASGKLLLAMSDDHEQLLDEILGRDIDRLTPHSRWEAGDLRAEMETIRCRCLASEHEEALVGFKSFAAPICDPGGRVIAALSVTVPVTHPAEVDLVAHLRAAAAAISRQHTRLAMSELRADAHAGGTSQPVG